MSTLKSSAEDLTLNADGSGNDIKFQSNGVEKASIDQDGNLVLSGTLTSVGIDDNATETAITIDATENIGIGVVPEDWHSAYDGGIVQINSQGAIFSQDAETYITNNVYEPQSGGMKYINTNVATLYSQQTGVHYFRTAASGSADAAVTWTTGFEVLNDGKARAKNGLLFGTDTAAANTLDDYEEGTWTPSITLGTASSVSGTYTKIGRVVTCNALLVFPSQTDSGHATIEGLPFTAQSGNPGFGGAVRYTNINTRQLMLHGNSGTTDVALYDVDYDSSVSSTTWTEISGIRLDFNLMYYV